MFKRLVLGTFTFFIFYFVFIPNAFAQTGPANLYKVSVTRFELFNGSAWVIIFDGQSITIDIASANAGGVAGNFISGVTVPDGTYTRSRVTVSTTFAIKGTDGAGNYTTATIGPGTGCTLTTTAASEAECTITINTVPTDTTTFTNPITITNGIPSHKVRVSFDVSTAIQNISGELFPAAPTVTVTTIAL